MAKKKNRKLRYIVGAIVLVLIAAAIFSPKKPNLTEVTVEKVAKRDITSQVTASGTIEPKTEVIISSEVAGEIVDLPVNDGDRVSKGQLLVRIDTEILQLRVQQQEASILAAKASAEQIRVQMIRAEQVLQDQEKLFRDQFVSEDSVREARASYDAIKASYEASLAQINQQQIQLDQEKKNLSKAIIYSPMDGIVSSRSVELGERVVGTGDYQGTEIMRVADFAVMELVIDVNETDVVNVSLGDLASISIDAISDMAFTGEVVEIASSATSSDSTEDAVTFEVKVRIDDPDGRIRPGMTATADIDTDHVDQALSVPLQSVTVRDKQAVAAPLAARSLPRRLGRERPHDEQGPSPHPCGAGQSPEAGFRLCGWQGADARGHDRYQRQPLHADIGRPQGGRDRRQRQLQRYRPRAEPRHAGEGHRAAEQQRQQRQQRRPRPSLT
jgi:HlyD family secretion protein